MTGSPSGSAQPPQRHPGGHGEPHSGQASPVALTRQSPATRSAARRCCRPTTGRRYATGCTGAACTTTCCASTRSEPTRTPRPSPARLPRAAWPIPLDTTGTVCYVQTRYLEPRPGQPKYDNPATRLGADTRLAWLRPPLPRDEHDLIICAGIPDALTAAQAGYRTVATLGTHAADPDVARTLAEHAASHRLLLTAVIDADPQDEPPARLTTLLAAHNVTLRIVEPANGLDLNGWAQHDPSWTNALTPANPTVSRPRTQVRHEPLTALRSRAAHTARPAPRPTRHR